MTLAVALHGEALKPDTQALGARLKAYRDHDSKQLSAGDFKTLQNALAAWIDKRLRTGATAAEMNAELKAAGAIKPEKTEYQDGQDVMVNFIGFLSEVSINPIRGASDLLDVSFGIGLMCGYDETVLVYERAQLLLIGRLEHHDRGSQDARGFSTIVAGPDDDAEGRLLASGTFSIWCTSTYIGVDLHIARIQNEVIQNLLDQNESARFFETSDKLVRISIDGHIVTFRYTASMGDAELMARPAIARYLVAGDKVTRIAPVALSRIGFIDEWLKMKNPEAAKWSRPEALAMHGEILTWFRNQAMHFESISRCSDLPRSWQIVISRFVYHHEQTQQFFLLMSEAGASEMQMLRIEKQANPNCTIVDKKALSEELPE